MSMTSRSSLRVQQVPVGGVPSPAATAAQLHPSSEITVSNERGMLTRIQFGGAWIQ